MSSPCQNSYIVLLTDGIPTKNTSKELVKKLVGVDSCQKVEYDIDGKKQSVSNGECGFELADFLSTTDNAPDLEGTQKIVTHTIGFQLGKGWVKVQDKDNCITPEVDADGKPVVGTDGKPVCAKYGSKYVEDIKETQINAAAQRYLADLSAKGHGQFFPINATSPEEAVQLLKNAFESILAQAVTSSTAFAAPSISVSTVSRLYHKNEVYFALFKPDQNAMWEGNIKKYRICEAGGSCKAGDILDSTGSSAVLNGYIAPDSRSIWNDGAQPDGAEIVQGGAGAKIPGPSGRKIYTYTGGEAAPGENHKIVLSEETVSVANKKLTAEALGLTTEGLSADQEEQKRKELINWIRGELSTGEQRWRFGDPLHSSPVALVYAGGADKKGTTRLFVGTNDGLVRVINADDDSGQEMWAFLPQELLSIQADLKKNEAGHRIYGVDATPTFLVNDGGDGIIDKDKGDSAQMFIGMRRGGTNLYALDVTDPDAPQLMWVIKGSKAVNGASQTSSPGFEKLGQTWSKPKPVRVARYSSKPVLLFGGGYHETQDESFSKVESGNAIYMVDTETGELVWWASSSIGKTESAAPFLELKGMDYAIPSDLALLDTKGAGVVNRIYVGDANGQVWRIDLDVGKNGVGGRLATLSGDPPTGVTNENKRRFFYPPDVVTRIKTGDLIYDLVVIVSGTRPDPLGTSTHDQFYALRDFAINGLVDKDDDGNADVDKTSFATLTAGDLVDVTDYIVPKSEGEASVVIEGLNDSKGWFVNLNQQPDKGEWAGEKGLASPIVLKGKVYFTTYLPPSGKEKDPCKPSEGKSYLYSLDILSGETALNSKQLALELKAGITSDIVLFFGKEGIRIITNDFSTPIHEELGDVPPGSGNSATNNGCGAGCYLNPANPIFWMQE
jgi:type IV pilus assembly protein PilY1